MPNIISVISQTFPGQPTWKAKDMPDLSGKVCLVTGGNAGVGYETVKALLLKNAKVYLAARSKNKAEAAIARLEEETGRKALFLELDLGDLASVRASAHAFLTLEEHLHILFENAGVMWPSHELLTKDGYDLQFGTNVIGHFLLMRLLLPALAAASASAPADPARVVITSSASVYLGALRWDTFRAGAERDKRSTQDLYDQSKLGNAVVAVEAASRFSAQNVAVTFVNPGIIKTELTRNASAVQMRVISKLQHPAEHGALPQLYAGTSPDTRDASGKFFVPWNKEGRIPKSATCTVSGARLWEWLEAETTLSGA